MDLQVFIITNERSTFPYARRCLDEQSIKPEIFEIKNMVWVDALNKMVDMCSTRYLIRCDDDFFLHRHAVEFMFESFLQKEKEDENVIMGLFKLWEDWAHRIIGGIKIYRVDHVRKLGGFKANYRGKVDGMFTKVVKKSPYVFTGDKHSVVGLHAGAPYEEQMRYAKIWSNIGDKPYVKWKPGKKTTKQMQRYSKPVEQQYEMTKIFLEDLNKEQDSRFYKFIREKKK